MQPSWHHGHCHTDDGLRLRMMGRVPAGRAVLAVVWVMPYLYFIFGIRTIAPEETAVSLDAARTKEDEAA